MNEAAYSKRNRNRHTVRERRTAVRICCGMVFSNPEKSRKYKLHMKIKHPEKDITPILDPHIIVAAGDITIETLGSHLRALTSS